LSGTPARGGLDRAIALGELAAGWLLAAVTAITFVSVVLRYLFAWSIPDGFDFGRNLLGILIFWGIALTGWRGDHITVDLVWGAFGKRAKRAIDVFADLVTLAAMAVFAWMTVDKVVATVASNVRTFDLRLPVWPFYAVAALGSMAAVLLLALRAFRVASGAMATHAAPRLD
jgi:TRAP-type C4-dicarboxylate transport system permease small subunit